MFCAPDDIVITGMSMASGGAAAVDCTFCRFLLYHVGDFLPDGAAAPYSFLPIARTASDTTIFGTTATLYARAWDTTGGWPAAVRLRRGEWYFAAHSITCSTTYPTVVGAALIRNSISNVQPRPGGAPGGMGTWTGEPWNYWTGGSYNYNAGGLAPWRNLTVDRTSTIPDAVPTVLFGESFFATYAGWFGWGNAQAGSKLVPVNNAGVGGEHLYQMLARIDTSVAPWSPDCVVIHAGTNDISAGETASTTQTRFTAIFDALDALGVSNIIVCTPPGNTTSTTEKKAELATLRAWLLGLSRAGVTVADTGMALSTGDGVTADATKLVDAVHPNLTGQQAMADVLDDVLTAVFG